MAREIGSHTVRPPLLVELFCISVKLMRFKTCPYKLLFCSVWMKRIISTIVLLYALSDASLAASGSNQPKSSSRRFLERTGATDFRSSGRPVGSAQKASKNYSGRQAINRRPSSPSPSRNAFSRPLRVSGSPGRISGQNGNISGNRLRVSGSQPNRSNLTVPRSGVRLR